MGAKCVKSVFISTVILPLTAGNKRRNSRFADGSISIKIGLLIWITIMFVLIPGHFRPYAEWTPTHTIRIVLVCNLCFGIIACLVILLIIAINGHHSISTYVRKSSVLKFRIFFLWTFLIGTLIDTVLEIIRDGECLKSFNFKNRWQYHNIVTSLMVNVILAMFCLISAIFQSVLVGYKLTNNIITKFTAISLVGGNLIIWLHAYTEIHFRDSKFEPDSNRTVANCYQDKNVTLLAITHIIKKAEATILTSQLQFSLLSINLLMEMWPSDKLVVSSLNFESVEEDNSTTDDDDQTLLKSPIANRQYSDASYGSVEFELHGRRFFALRYVSIIASTILAIVLNFGRIFLVTTEKDSEKYSRDFLIFMCIYKTLMVISLYASFFCISDYLHLIGYKEYTPRELVMIAGVFFALQYHTYKLIACFLSDITVDIKFLIFESCLSILLEYLQMVLLLQLNRFRNKQNIGNNARWLKHCVSFTAFLVLGLWCSDSYIGIKYGTHTLVRHAIGAKEWNLITFVVYPAFVFHRFTIFFAGISLYEEI